MIEGKNGNFVQNPKAYIGFRKVKNKIKKRFNSK